jgi:hypothetical protein
MEDIEITGPMALTLDTIFQFWKDQYRELWLDVQYLHKRNPNQKEIKEAFAKLCERHAGLSFYHGLTKETFVELALMIKERIRKKPKKIKNQNQISLDFPESESKPTNKRTLTGSLDEQLRITTGFYSSATTKKYNKIRKNRPK